MGKKILFAAAMLLLVAGYFLNLTFALVRIEASGERLRLFFMVFYALVYLSCWLLFLIASRKRNSKPLLRLYQIFWLLAAVFFFLTPLIPPASVLDGIAAIVWFVFGAPLVGLDGFIFHITGDSYAHSATLYAALTASIIMLLFGVFSDWKRKQ